MRVAAAMTAAVRAHIGGEPQTYVSRDRRRGRADRVDMRFVTHARRRGDAGARSVSLETALFEGLAPDGGLYVPEAIDPWPTDEIERLPRSDAHRDRPTACCVPSCAASSTPTTLEAVVVDSAELSDSARSRSSPASSRSSCSMDRRSRSRTSARGHGAA